MWVFIASSDSRRGSCWRVDSAPRFARSACQAVSAPSRAVGGVSAVLTADYQEDLLKDYSSSQIAWIGSTQAAVCFSTCLFTGPLFDRYGCRPLLATGTFLLVLAFCMLSLCKEYYQIFLCHATLMAMGMDLMFIVPMGAVGQWFFLKRGLAFGILMTGSSIGAIVWPVIIANLPARIGFPWTVRLIALLIGILGTVSAMLVKTRLPPRPSGPFFHFAEFKNPAYLMVALSFPFFAFGFFSFLTFIGTYGSLAGLGTLAPYLLMIANGASGFGRVSAGSEYSAFITDPSHRRQARHIQRPHHGAADHGDSHVLVAGNVVCWAAHRPVHSLRLCLGCPGVSPGAKHHRLGHRPAASRHAHRPGIGWVMGSTC